MDGSNTVASASYREPRPHARSAAARQEKTRGRRRISRKAPDLPHDAVRAGAESDGRLHTGTTSPEGHSGPSMGKGQLGPFAQSSPPGSHWGIRGVVDDARRDNSPGSGAISSSKSLLHICQQNYKKAKGEGNPSPFLFTVYSVSFSRSASTAVSLPRLIS